MYQAKPLIKIYHVTPNVSNTDTVSIDVSLLKLELVLSTSHHISNRHIHVRHISPLGIKFLIVQNDAL